MGCFLVCGLFLGGLPLLRVEAGEFMKFENVKWMQAMDEGSDEATPIRAPAECAGMASMRHSQVSEWVRSAR